MTSNFNSEINVATFEQISTRLSQLLINYSNMASDFYDLFYNSEPKNITLNLYNAEGTLIPHVIPNRAKDFRYVQNGVGSPEGVVSAEIGTIYMDTQNGILYIKQIGSGSAGWVEVGMNSGPEKGSGSPEGVLNREKGSLYIDTTTASLYIKSTSYGNTGWVMISANSSLLATRDLDNLTTAGEAHFANPSLSNLNNVGQAVINNKASINLDDLTTTGEAHFANPSLSNLNTTGQAVLDAKANLSLSNLNVDGEMHFVGHDRLQSCILSAPTGVLSRNGNNLTLPAGIILLGSNGNNSATNSRNNVKITLADTKTLAVPTSTSAGTYRVFYDSSRDLLFIVGANEPYYYDSTVTPTITENAVWWNPWENTYYYSSSSAWLPSIMIEVGWVYVDNNGSITNFGPIGSFTITSFYQAGKNIIIDNGKISAGINVSYEV